MMNHASVGAPVAIVTGSSSGVGAATARLLCEHGWRVVINYASNVEGAEAVAADCRTLGGEVLVCGADVASDEDCRTLVSVATDAWGQLDGLVNNAGRTVFNWNHANLDGLNADDFLNIYRINLIGPYQMIRAAEPWLRNSERPSVVNIASIAAVTGMGSSVAYAASKGALVTMTLSLARALGPIRMNAICPGFIQGDWLREGLGEEVYDNVKAALEASAPLGATATPESVAEAILYFLQAGTITTGETLILDGGVHLGGASQGRK